MGPERAIIGSRLVSIIDIIDDRGIAIVRAAVGTAHAL